VRRCLYGLDLNPLAGALAKVSLWLETLEPGRPLTFLDTRLRQGDSLVGLLFEGAAAGATRGLAIWPEDATQGLVTYLKNEAGERGRPVQERLKRRRGRADREQLSLPGFGPAAVAAFGVAGRIEMFSFMIPMTVGMSLIPFIAQNYGAGRRDRVRTGYKGATLFAVAFGLLIAAGFTAAARPLAGLFSRDPAAVEVLVRYIRITCFGYGMLEVHRYATFCMTGIHRPLISAGLNALRLLVFLIPLSYLGAGLAGLDGMFFARLATDFLAAGIGVGVVLRKTRAPASST